VPLSTVAFWLDLGGRFTTLPATPGAVQFMPVNQLLFRAPFTTVGPCQVSVCAYKADVPMQRTFSTIATDHQLPHGEPTRNRIEHFTIRASSKFLSGMATLAFAKANQLSGGQSARSVKRLLKRCRAPKRAAM